MCMRLSDRCVPIFCAHTWTMCPPIFSSSWDKGPSGQVLTHDTSKRIETGAPDPWLRPAGHGRRFARRGQYICIDTVKSDVQTVGPGPNRLGDAHPRQGVRVYHRREHGSPFSPRCAEPGTGPGRYVEHFSGGTGRGRTPAPKAKRATRRG